MPIDTTHLANFVVWNLALKCNTSILRHRHSIPDYAADQYLLFLERLFQEKRLTPSDVLIDVDDREYRRARTRIFPDGRYDPSAIPTRLPRERNARAVPLSSEKLQKIFTLALKATNQAAPVYDALEALKATDRAYRMVRHLMRRLSGRKKRLTEDEVWLFGWRPFDAWDKSIEPQLDERGVWDSGHPGCPASVVGPLNLVPFAAFQTPDRADPIFYQNKRHSLGMQVCRDMTFRQVLYDVVVVMFAHAPNGAAYLEAALTAGWERAIAGDLATSEAPFRCTAFRLPNELTWVCVVESFGDNRSYIMMCGESGDPKLFLSELAVRQFFQRSFVG